MTSQALIFEEIISEKVFEENKKKNSYKAISHF